MRHSLLAGFGVPAGGGLLDRTFLGQPRLLHYSALLMCTGFYNLDSLGRTIGRFAGLFGVGQVRSTQA
ncbi:MAG: hypothetical protein HC849_17780 [Oscillatoriales cyanobacterium RU_3_3]|nr:hypothetical protein [Microcoleus sp. SU_5_6]NJL68869.1 hypothetical protein [Microcoleus sp. SM1_3_4]NJM61625.1 hypothetical protein [Oscillatoriales cyanobacterium RU_3_3]NJR23009.1 hypothetical protein [Richelia sp. CSU_2_1]